MADTRLRLKSEVLPIRAESAKLLLPEEIGSEVKNMYFTEEGTIRSVWGPAPYVPNYGAGYPSYQTMKGIFHARLGQNGERDILLAQWDGAIWVFEGWNAGVSAVWRPLVGRALLAPQRDAKFSEDDKARFPAQFISTSNGIVIIPSGATTRAYFYDGAEVLPLGYSSAPGAPVSLGPSTGFTKTAAPLMLYGKGRVGSVALDSVDTTQAGRIAPSSYRAATQWVDRWGNLSAVSGRSAPERNPGQASSATPEDAIPQLRWVGISKGPEGTIGRMLLRTKNEETSGTLDLFELSGYAAEGFLSFSTIPDNVVTSFADNTPDSWLIRKPEAVVTVPSFKLYAVAFGRGWAANFDGDPGRVHSTLPGRWGTFEEFAEIYPDPSGNEITGLQTVSEGLLVFTESSTFLISPSNTGEGFVSQTLHPTIGCVAPSSISTMPDGQTVWLGREGFFMHTPGQIAGGQMIPGQIQLVSTPIDKHVRGFNKARMLQACAAVDVREGVYRCWVADQASTTNNVCWEFDGTGWKRRTDVQAAAVCVTSDHRAMMLVAGQAQKTKGAYSEGVWVLDHQVGSWKPEARESTVKTAWLRSSRSKMRGSPLTVYLWLRARESGTLNVKVQRDWKSMVTQTVTAPLHAAEDTPAFWDTAILGTGTWEQSRPYWTRVDIFAPSAEVFRLEISHTADWEFIAIAFDEAPQGDTFRSAPK